MKLVFLFKEMNEQLAMERQNVALSKIKLLNHSKELIRINIKYSQIGINIILINAFISFHI